MKNTIKLSIFKKAFQSDIKIIKVLYVIITILIIAGAFLFTETKYKETADFVSKTFHKRDSIIRLAMDNIKPDIPQNKQIKEQYLIIEEIKTSYLFIARRYTSYNYSFSIFFTIFSILSGILGFLLLKNGWDNTKNYYLKSSFLIVFFCSTLFGVLPNVFGTKENIKNNLSKYHFYSGLQLDLYDLGKDNKNYLKRNTEKSLDSLNQEISSITKQIKENQDLYFDIYIDKIPKDIKPFD